MRKQKNALSGGRPTWTSAIYDDFYVAGRAEAEAQLKNAKYFVQKVEEYINSTDE